MVNERLYILSQFATKQLLQQGEMAGVLTS